MWLDIILSVAITGPLLLRRRFPFGAPLAVGAGVVIASFADNSLVPFDFIAFLAGCAAVLRLVALSSLPDGLHGDEADAGLQAARVLHSGNIGAYTPALHGTPTGP